MTNNNNIEIANSKTKLLKLLLFCILFLIAGFWMGITHPQTSNPVFNNSILKMLSAGLSIILGVVGLFAMMKKLLDKKPGLIINESGIYDNTSVFKFGLIPWSDISQIFDHEVKVSASSTQRFITIGLTDPDKYISRETGSIKRKMMEANAKNFNSPVHISTNTLKIDHKELVEIINTCFKKYKH